MLVDGEQPAGEQDVHWDGRDDGGRPVASGVLMLRLAAEGVVLTKRVVILD